MASWEWNFLNFPSIILNEVEVLLCGFVSLQRGRALILNLLYLAADPDAGGLDVGSGDHCSSARLP
jgi:hypothetical protein